MVSNDQSKQVIVNLSEVSFLDSSALSVLVQEMKRVVNEAAT